MSLKPPTLSSSSELSQEDDSLKPPTVFEATVEESIEVTEVDEVADGSLKPPTP
jgi:hypothetical protein